MARRIWEAAQRQRDGVDWQPMGKPKSVSVARVVKFHNTYRGIYSLQFNATGDVLAIGFGSGGIQLVDSATGKMTKELRSCRQGGHSIMTLRFHPKQPNILYATSTEGSILIYNCDTREEIGQILEHGNETNCLDFSVDGYNFATGGTDLNIRIYETKSNKEIQVFKGHTGMVSSDKNKMTNTARVFALCYHPDNQYIFVSGGWDNHLKIWDMRSTDGIKRNIAGPHICGDALDMKGTTILTGQWTALHSLQEYNYTDGRVVKELKYPHADGAFLYCAQYCNDDLVVAGGSGTNCANFIQISTNKMIGEQRLEGPVQAIDTSKDGRIAAVGGAASSCIILKVSD